MKKNDQIVERIRNKRIAASVEHPQVKEGLLYKGFFSDCYNLLVLSGRLGLEHYIDYPQKNGENLRMFSSVICATNSNPIGRFEALKEYYEKIHDNSLEESGLLGNTFYIDEMGNYTPESTKALAPYLFGNDEKLISDWKKAIDYYKSSQDNLDDAIKILYMLHTNDAFEQYAHKHINAYQLEISEKPNIMNWVSHFGGERGGKFLDIVAPGWHKYLGKPTPNSKREPTTKDAPSI